jgi:hypothetical protein
LESGVTPIKARRRVVVPTIVALACVLPLLVTHAALADATSSRAGQSVQAHIRLHIKASSKPLAIVLGDSLITQAAAQLAADVSNVKIDQFSYPAQAACHYLGTVKSYLKSHRPQVAIIEFFGNDNKDTPCINKYPIESPGYYAQYKANVSTMVRELVRARAHVFVIGVIPDAAQVAAADRHWDELNVIYSAIARAYTKRVVTFVNVQQIIESGGRFTWYLPCLRGETSCDASISGIDAPPPSGNNIVRSSEGLHFCPLYPTTPNGLYNFTHCKTYASGTHRYAGFIANAVENYLTLRDAPKFLGVPLPPPNTAEVGVAGQVDPYTGTIYPQT